MIKNPAAVSLFFTSGILSKSHGLANAYNTMGENVDRVQSFKADRAIIRSSRGRHLERFVAEYESRFERKYGF